MKPRQFRVGTSPLRWLPEIVAIEGNHVVFADGRRRGKGGLRTAVKRASLRRCGRCGGHGRDHGGGSSPLCLDCQAKVRSGDPLPFIKTYAGFTVGEEVLRDKTVDGFAWCSDRVVVVVDGKQMATGDLKRAIAAAKKRVCARCGERGKDHGGNKSPMCVDCQAKVRPGDLLPFIKTYGGFTVGEEVLHDQTVDGFAWSGRIVVVVVDGKRMKISHLKAAIAAAEKPCAHCGRTGIPHKGKSIACGECMPTLKDGDPLPFYEPNEKRTSQVAASVREVLGYVTYCPADGVWGACCTTRCPHCTRETTVTFDNLCKGCPCKSDYVDLTRRHSESWEALGPKWNNNLDCMAWTLRHRETGRIEVMVPHDTARIMVTGDYLKAIKESRKFSQDAFRWGKKPDMANVFNAILGCTFGAYRRMLEEQREADGLHWGNAAKDHILPISSADTVEMAWLLAHHTNLRAICTKANNKKRDKVTPEQAVEIAEIRFALSAKAGKPRDLESCWKGMNPIVEDYDFSEGA